MAKQSQTRMPKIWVVGGGKGGTGKTFVTSSLGIYLSEKRRKDVCLLDADLGGANLHSVFGIKQPKRSLNDFFEFNVPLDELRIETGIDNLSLIAGDIHSLSADNIRFTQKKKLFRHIKQLNSRYIILDVGGGSHFNIIDTFLFADIGIAVMTPDILAVENMYQFMKNVIYRKLRMTLRFYGFKGLAQDTWTKRELYKINNLRELLDFFTHFPETRDIVHEAFSEFKIYLILNKVRSMQDIHLGASIKSTFQKYLGIDTQYVGFLEYDDSIWKSTRQQKPFLVHHADSRFATEIELFTENLLRGNELNLWEE
jgi:flagellar biosynthesis protein FlhG